MPRPLIVTAQKASTKNRAPRQFTQTQRDRYAVLNQEIARHKEVLKSLGQLYRSLGVLFKEVEAQGLYELEGYDSFKQWLWDKHQISLDHAGKYKRIATELTEADVQGRDLCLNGWVLLARAQGEMRTLLLEMVDRHQPTAETLERALRMGQAKADEGGSVQEVRQVIDAIGRLGATALPRLEGPARPGPRADDLPRLVRKLFQGFQKLEGTAAVAEKRHKAGDRVPDEDLEQLLKLGGECYRAIVELARAQLGPAAVGPLLREIFGAAIYKEEEEVAAAPDLPELEHEPELEQQRGDQRRTAREEARPARKTARQLEREREYEEQNRQFDELLKPRVYEQPDLDEPPPIAYVEYLRALKEADAEREVEEREERRQRNQRRWRKMYQEEGLSEESIEEMLRLSWEEDAHAE